jgi:hypothetical protein
MPLRLGTPREGIDGTSMRSFCNLPTPAALTRRSRHDHQSDRA